MRRPLYHALVALFVVGTLAPVGVANQPQSPVLTAQAGRVTVDFWHGLRGVAGRLLEDIAVEFSASQARYTVNATFRGSYPETMVAAIAAFRAGNAPHIVQMFEVGTATMMAARGAIKPVYQLMREAGIPLDPRIYLPAVRGYYSAPDGRMIAMPFNSSTAVMWYNRDAFRRAGLDPARPPQTWAELRAAAKRIRDTGAAPCGFTFAWPTWTQFEQFSAIHDTPLATRSNGFEGMDAELRINSALHVRHMQTLADMLREGSFRYGGRDAAADGLFPSGECAIIHASSGIRGGVIRDARFDWGVTFLPYYDDVKGAPKNSIIGGAAFWVMTAPRRTADEYRAVAEFFQFIGRPEIVARWHMETGFLPITFPGIQLVQSLGYYERNPGADIPFKQLTRTLPTANTRGLRLGNMPEIRVVIQEEMELMFQGQKSARAAMDSAVRRGNEILRRFEQLHARQ
jgi:sn-glycerol 3-phosphate transport system substrate-binding protein